MRVVGGEWRGRRLEEPRGRDVTRPTTDRAREACASICESALDGGIPGARVLDAFAGSGALGIEMLSRGAAHATFYDVDRKAAALVAKNLARLGCDRGRYRVLTGDAVLAAGRGRVPGAPFDLVLMDPPYRLGTAPGEAVLSGLVAAGRLAPGAIALFERSEAGTPALEVPGFELLRTRRYGIAAVDVMRLVG